MKFFNNIMLLLLSSTLALSQKSVIQEELCHESHLIKSNTCINFSVGQGTGCSWMCNYCATQLGTSNYYFTDGVCTYQTGGCVGNPQAGVTYTCCTL